MGEIIEMHVYRYEFDSDDDDRNEYCHRNDDADRVETTNHALRTIFDELLTATVAASDDIDESATTMR